MKVSIAMATYNGSSYLKEQLDSFVSQTRLPDELIITDDCSTDDTVKIIEKFAENSPFPVLLYINKKNLGYSCNFNAALEKTTGELVFLSDQDDVWFPEKIKYMTQLAEENPKALALMNDAALTDDLLNEVKLTKIGQIKSAGLPLSTFVMGCCCVVRRDLLEICMPIPVAFKGHDSWIICFAAGLNAKIVSNQVLQYYRRHDSNESQFIANSTRKTTPLQLFIYRVKKGLNKETSKYDLIDLQQAEILANGIEAAINIAPKKYISKLSSFLYIKKNEISFSGLRIEARRNPLLSRIILIIKLNNKGAYSGSSGLKEVIRDIIGYRND